MSILETKADVIANFDIVDGLVDNTVYRKQMLYVPVMFSRYLAGEHGGLHEDGTIHFIVDEYTRAQFPELGDKDEVVLVENKDGTVIEIV